MAETEPSGPARPCLDRRIGSAEGLRAEAARWVEGRNAGGSAVVRKFTTD